MKRLAIILALSCLLALGGSAFAELCTIDAVPAATLLLPYFEVDLAAGPGEGVDTLFSVNNASAAPAIAHVAVWTDWSQPVLDFDIFLTGYDVQSISLYQVLALGNVPVTADEQSDQPDDDISPSGDGSGETDDCEMPQGADPDWDCSFTGAALTGDGVADCDDIFPFFINPLLTGTRLSDIQDKLTGKDLGTDGDECYGADYGDDVARGYITIDNAQACSLIFPADPDYFYDGADTNTGIASNYNQLWGDWFIVDPVNAFAEGDNLVHIEATDDVAFPESATTYTFYSRYTQDPAIGGSDNREPLATTWAARYLNGGAFDNSSFTVWRDSTVNDIDADGYDCGPAGWVGAGPEWHPLNETQVVAFDEREDPELLCQPTVEDDVISPPIVTTDDPVCFPLETQKVATGIGDLDPSAMFGWMYLNLNVGVDGAFVNFDLDLGSGGTLAQSYVSVSHSALGLYSVGLPAIQLTSACDDLDPVIDLP